jgi:ABC-2 type transport system permease protein
MIARLTLIELRKAVDTRAGPGLLVAIGASVAAVAGLQLALADVRTWTSVVANAQQPVSVLAPLLGLLLVTGEWSQRTALTTFVLVPSRSRIVAAKLVAASLLSVATTSAGFAIAFAFLAGRDWEFSGAVVAQLALVNWLTMMFGTSFGLLLWHSAPAIVVYYVVPFAWTFVGRIVPGLDTVSPWLDLGQSRAPLAEAGVGGPEWAHVLTSSLLWIVVPAVLGTLRLRRADLG